MRPIALLVFLAGCASDTRPIGDFILEVDKRNGTITVAHQVLPDTLDDLSFATGSGDADVEMQFGSFRFSDESLDLVRPARASRITGNREIRSVELFDEERNPIGVVDFVSGPSLAITFTPTNPGDRQAVSAACDADDHFMGLGGYALDVDHVGEAFDLWVQEPGIGRVDTEEDPEDWFITGNRHDSSTPVPFVVRPHRGQGLFLDTAGRITADLCATSDRFELVAWDDEPLNVSFFQEAAPGEVTRRFRQQIGNPSLPPPWVFGPWVDAVRGQDRVREVVDRLQTFGAPTTAVWTEDFKGGEDILIGYHISGEWTVDRDLYPDAEQVADELEADGIKWLAYFSPFLFEGTDAWDKALEQDAILRDDEGEPYTFFGPTFEVTSMVDLSTTEGQDFVLEHTDLALDIGFDGWMADFAEWLPTDLTLGNGMSGLDAHNIYPEYWQSLHRTAIAGTDASFFVRSAWTKTGSIAPVVWAGDQETTFDSLDGMPSVLPMGIGLSVTGVPVFTHDVAGYSSQQTDPADKELWFRWASFGAFTPVLRTHHGAYERDNWQFYSDDESTEHWAAVATEHMRLFPYRYGLAARAAMNGTPMIQPVAWVAGEDWGRTDAWMLGDALLVAPVMERGATSREVVLPVEAEWVTWDGHQPAETGSFDAALDKIPVFARMGTIVPTFTTVPDTLVESETAVDLSDVDNERTLYVFGSGGVFQEADGTRYEATGSPGESETTVETLSSGTVSAGGLSVAISGETERTYTVVVVVPSE